MSHWEVDDIQVILSPRVWGVRKLMKKHARFFGEAVKLVEYIAIKRQIKV